MEVMRRKYRVFIRKRWIMMDKEIEIRMREESPRVSYRLKELWRLDAGFLI